MKIFKTIPEERKFQGQLWFVATLSYLVIILTRLFFKDTYGHDPTVISAVDFYLVPLAATIIILAPKIMNLSKIQIILRSVSITLLFMVAYFVLEKLG